MHGRILFGLRNWLERAVRRSAEREARVRYILDERDRVGFSAGCSTWDASGAFPGRQDRSKVDDDVAGTRVPSRLDVHHNWGDYVRAFSHGQIDNRRLWRNVLRRRADVLGRDFRKRDQRYERKRKLQQNCALPKEKYSCFRSVSKNIKILAP